MYFKIISFLTKNKITKIEIISANGSKFSLDYSVNMLLDVDILKLVNSKNMLALHSNIISIISEYNLTLEGNFLVKEFLKWIMYNVNIVHIEI